MPRRWLPAVAGAIAIAGAIGVSVGGVAAAPASKLGSGAPGYRVAAEAAPAQSVSLTVSLPLRNTATLQSLLSGQVNPGSPDYHHWLTPSEFQSEFGVQPTTVATLRHSLARFGLQVSPFGAQAVTVTGRAAAVNSAFHAQLAFVKRDDGQTALATLRPMVAPDPIRSVGGVVDDLSPIVHLLPTSERVPTNRYGRLGSYWADDLKQAYQYPAFGSPSQDEADGAGTTVGIVMEDSTGVKDDDKYWTLEKSPQPHVSIVKIHGGGPYSPSSDGTFEANLDVQQVGGIAPDTNIIQYSVPDLSDQSITDAYTAVVQQNKVDVVSGSFGGCELVYTAAYNDGTSSTSTLRAENTLFEQADAQGITTIFSSGDSGSLACPPVSYFSRSGSSAKFLRAVETPADSPNVIAVGGTNLVTAHTNGSLNSAYVSENESGDKMAPYDPYGTGKKVSGGYWGSGGGFSKVFKAPAYQPVAKGSGRSVPDVALHMGGCPSGASVCAHQDSSDVEIIGGTDTGVIGTSASAPDFAGTVALMDQVEGTRVGDINPTLYQLAAEQKAGTLAYPVFHEAIPGFTGYYSTAYTASYETKPGFDQVIGVGTPIVKNLIFGSADTPAAGIPGTASNP
jgi:subtilase family serine protease